ncbi:MAG: FlgD immunoglobulin-like domain containing protein [Candidatus Latescibacterota bacterium]
MVGLLVTLLALAMAAPAAAEFRCAGIVAARGAAGAARAAAAVASTTGRWRAVLVFAQFRGENPGWPAVPAWSAGFFDPERPGSFPHFYRTMSLGRLTVTGAVAPRPYASRQGPAAYLAEDPGSSGRYGAFAREILSRADQEVDFATFDSDGPDGVPASGDDDGFVDAVFIVVASAPPGFIMGNATGAGYVDLGGSFQTDDADAQGRTICIDPERVTLQLGRTFSEAVGSACHEFGHVLGLPDLYDVGFLRQHSTDPGEDSAGIGRWGLMGWGTLGWRGDDGPASLCAWSRVRLGWADVTSWVVGPERTVRLAPVERTGQVCLVALPGTDYLLLENRQRQGCYYDRHVPGEGLLIWRAAGNEGEGQRWGGVDLECADGRWRDAGFPVGQEPDPLEGGDNLDFWAHDAAYREAHAGNLGDATDPFDGVAYIRFTEATNPASGAGDQPGTVRVDSIRRDGDAMVARVTTPLAVHCAPVVADGDGVLLAGEEGVVRLPAEGVSAQVDLWRHSGAQVRIILGSDDPLVEVLDRYRAYGDHRPMAFRITDAFTGVHTASLWLEVRLQGAGGSHLLWRQTVEATALSPRQLLLGATVVDTLGNGDGRVQVGEVFGLSLSCSGLPARVRPALCWGLRTLDPRLVLVGRRPVDLAGPDSLARTTGGPQYLAAGDLRPGEPLTFAVECRTAASRWSDTLQAAVAPGPDPSPPVVLGLHQGPLPGGIRLTVAAEEVIDASPVDSVWVEIGRLQTPGPLARVGLTRRDDAWVGTWSPPDPGEYRARAWACDQAGNCASGPLRLLASEAPSERASIGDAAITLGDGPLCGAVFLAGGERVAFADGRSLRLLDAVHHVPSTELAGHAARITGVAAAGAAPRLFSGDRSGELRVWDAASGLPLAVLQGGAGPVLAVACSADGRVLAAAGAGPVCLWRAGVQVGRLEYPQVGVLPRVLAYLPGERLLLVGDSDGGVVLWDVERQERQREVGRHAGPITALAADPAWLASGAASGTLHLRELDPPEQLFVLFDDARRPVTSLAISADGAYLASGHTDGVIRLWNTRTRGQEATLEGHVDDVTGLAFSADGMQVASASADGTLRLWLAPLGAGGPLPPGQPLVDLLAPYPNPFNGSVRLPFRLLRSAAAVVSIHDVTGRLVRRIDLGRLPVGRYLAGEQAARWDGRDQAGRRVASGVYLYRVEAGDGGRAASTRRVVLVR